MPKYRVKMNVDCTRSWVYRRFFFIWWNVDYNNGRSPREAVEIYEQQKKRYYVTV